MEALSAAEQRAHGRATELEARLRELEARARELDRANRELSWLAHHDSLTGLPNRLLFGRRFDRAIARACRWRRRFAVLIVDLDRFKSVNDRFGHHVGDLVLQVVAGCIVASVRTSDTVARLGGDEFAVLAEGVRASRDRDAVVRAVSDALHVSFEVAGCHIQSSASVGAAQFPEDGHTQDRLMRVADANMYRAKVPLPASEHEGRAVGRLRGDAGPRRRLALEVSASGSIDEAYRQYLLQPGDGAGDPARGAARRGRGRGR